MLLFRPYSTYKFNIENEAPRSLPPPWPRWKHLPVFLRHQGAIIIVVLPEWLLIIEQSVLESVGIEADDERLDKLLEELEGKNLQEVRLYKRLLMREQRGIQLD